MDTAFDPNTTSPEGQEQKAAAESVCAECLEFVIASELSRGDERIGAAVSGLVGRLMGGLVNGIVSFVLKVVAV